MRTFRPSISTLNKTLALGGVVIVLIQVLWIAHTRVQVAVIGAGILINQIGVWGLAGRVLGERRVNLQLRSEVHAFLSLVRELNRQSVGGEKAAVDATRTAMHQAVDRMASVAGVTTASDSDASSSEVGPD